MNIPTLDIRYMFSRGYQLFHVYRVYHLLLVFPRLQPVQCFPTCSLFNVFPRLTTIYHAAADVLLINCQFATLFP